MKIHSIYTGIVVSAGLLALGLPAFATTTVNLGTAGNYTILTKTGVTNTGATRVRGNMGVSPITSTAITGFALTRTAPTYSTSSLVTGKVFAADYAPPTPARLTTAIGDMQKAYDNAAGRKNPNHIELGSGNIGGMKLRPGLYKWSTAVNIGSNVTLSGSPTGIWVFQIAGTLNVASGAKVFLVGGALAKNVFWQVAGATTLQTTSVLRGTVLDKTAIVLKTGAVLRGKALTQTALTLDANVVAP